MPAFSQRKICFLAGTLEHGGAERQLFYVVQALCRHGVSPRVLCFDQRQFWEDRIRSLGVPVSWVGQRQSRLARLGRVLKELRSDPPDLFQSQHFFANAYVALGAAVLRIRGVGAIRNEGTAELHKNGRIGGWINLHLPSLIAANSRLAIRQALELGIPSSRLFFLPNVVDTQCFRPAAHATGRSLTLVSVGRLVKEKRFDRFITILGRLRTEFGLDVKGWIVGPTQDPTVRKDLQDQAARAGLFPKFLRFLGGVSGMAALYRQADICVLTSDFEGTPNVLLEAMASGLPVVATNVGGVPDIVQQGKTGFRAECTDMEGLTAGAVELVKNAALRAEMGRKAREFVEEQHALDRLPVYLDELYARALEPSRARKLRSADATAVTTSSPCSGSAA